MLIRKYAVMGPISVLLCCQITLAQQTPVAFTIGVIQGDGAVNFVNRKPAQVPAVKVEDSSGHPIAGAKVTFQAPDSGPSAIFNGARMYAAVTGRDGTAKAVGFTPNTVTGPFMVHVLAEYEGQATDKQIQQSNVAPPAQAKSNHRKLALKIAIGAAAAVGFGVILYEEFIAKNKPYGQR